MTAALEAFRTEVRGWLEANAPQGLRGTRMGRFDGYWGGRRGKPTADEAVWLERMLSRGFTAPMWPKEYGGAGLSKDEAQVLDQELIRLAMPPAAVGFGLTMLGPTLLHFGNAEQKAEHLPAIVDNRVRWSQGYSEPGAGSDLAALQMKAVQEGDEFVVTGQKIWTSHADKSDWIFCLVRTDPSAKKQQGISFLLIDLQSRGVSSRPISLISGSSPFCEVFMDEVRVPARNLVGKLNEGWTIAKALLGFERTMIGDAIGGQMAQAESLLLASARQQYGVAEGEPLDALTRDAIARIAMDERAFGLVRERIRQTTESGKTPGPESSITKAYGADLKQRRYELAMRLLGPEAVGWEGAPFDQTGLDTGREWLRARANSIEGGSSEIQLNVIAQHVLGLPK